MQDTHQQAITEKNNTLGLIRDDLESQRGIAKLKQNNLELKVAVQRRAVEVQSLSSR